jgi:signal transduction histidine kinase
MLVHETSQNNKISIAFRKSGQERRLSHETELALYRIAQEALTNIVKHSQAAEAELRMDFDDSQILMEIVDHGIGFDMPKSPTDFAPSGHFGLLGIRERADLIGARLEVDSSSGKGTRLTVRL